MIIRMTPQEISNPVFQKFASDVLGEPPRGTKKFLYILVGPYKTVERDGSLRTPWSRAASLPFAN